MVEWSITTDCKSVAFGLRRFESSPAHISINFKKMTEKEFFVKTARDEGPRFERVFKALPENLEDLRHHPKNKNAMELVSTMAYESAMLPGFITTGMIDFSKGEKIEEKTVAGLADIFKENLNNAADLVEKMSEEKWSEAGKMMSGEKVEWEAVKSEMVWGLLLDLIHHRGQLSTYIRPHGGKVPSIYGPSGDMNG